MLRLKIFIIILIVFLGFSSSSTGDITSCKNLLSYISILYILDNETGTDMMVDIIDSLDPFYEKDKLFVFYKTIITSNDKYLEYLNETKKLRSIDGKKTEFIVEININSKETIIESFELNSFEQISEYIKMNAKIFGDFKAIPDKFLKRFKKFQESKIKK